MAIDIITLIFETILKIDPYLISEYASIPDQLLYLILIPHTILFLFLWSFGYWVVPKHMGLRLLLTAVSYIFIIYGGWYGTFLVPIIIPWFKILLGGMLLFFIVSRIFHPETVKGLYGMMGDASGIARSAGKKAKEADTVQKEIREIDKRIKELAPGAKTNPFTAQELSQLKSRRRALAEALKKM